MTPEERKELQRKFTFLSDVEELPPSWLWRNWFQLGCVTILGGMPKTCKSTLMSDIAARVTCNKAMPDGTVCEAPGGVVWISYEEDTAERIAPRFREQGGDKSKFIDLSNVKRKIRQPGEASSAPFELPTDEQELKDAIRAVHATLVLIDPLMSMSAKNKRIAGNQTARSIVGSLQQLAKDTGVAVVILNHFTKANLKDPLRAMSGSQGFIDFVRSVCMTTKDEGNPQHIILSLLKNSNAPDVPQVVFQQHDGAIVEYLEGITPEQEARYEQDQAKMNERNVLELLAEFPNREFIPSYVAQELDVNESTIRGLMRRMAMSGKIVQTTYGKYKAKPTRKKKTA